LSRHSQVFEVGDYLASQAGATIIYLFFGTEQDVAQGEWRGMNPLAALAGFADAAGLRVETPTPGLWVIGPEWRSKEAAVTIFVHSLDPASQGLRPTKEVGGLERALVSQLPVRDTEVFASDTALGVGYYWLRDEGPQTLLVVGSSRPMDNPNFTFLKVFKVQVRLVSGSLMVDCLWSSREVGGRFIPEIAEDFDGDGSRDFVFDSDGRDHVSTTVLSGKDGSLLASLSGNELAVEKSQGGRKRFAVDYLVGMKFDGEESGPDGETRKGPFVLEFDRQDRSLEVEEERDIPQASAATPRPRLPFTAGPRQLLTQALGDPGRVRVYLLQPGAALPRAGFEEVPQQRYTWNLAVTSDSIAKGYPARILYRYESAGFKETLRLRNTGAPK